MQTVFYFKNIDNQPARRKLAGFSEVAKQYDWNVKTISPRERNIRQLLDFWHPIGCVVNSASGWNNFNGKLFKKTPVVFIDRPPKQLQKSDSYVYHDSADTVALAMRELLSRSPRFCGYVSWPVAHAWNQERQDAFLRIARLNDCPCAVFQSTLPPDDNHKLPHKLATWLKSLPKPMAILAAADPMGIQVINACEIAGLSVPGDVYVCGIDNDEDICTTTSPTLTSAAPDHRAAGRRAGEILAAILENRNTGAIRENYGNGHLTRRSSTMQFRRYDQACRKVCELIQGQACGNFTVQDALAVFGCSRRNAEYRFRATTGMSIHEMINETRLSYGQELLRETEKDLAEISSLCGYTSAAAFAHFFKSRTGQPPRIWRKTAKALCLMTALAQQNILADTIDITRAGIRNDGISDQSHAIERLVSEGKAGTEFVFPAGVYLLNKTVTVSRKTDLAIKGETGAVLKLHFTPWGPLSENSRAFDFGFCNRLRIEGFTVTTDHPTSCAGRIVAMDPALGTYDVRIADEFPLTGWEHFWGVDTCDESGMPDYALETYEQVTAAEVSDGQGGKRTKMTGTKYRLLSPQLIRVTAPGGSTFDFRRLRLGHRILFRYAIYGSTAFYFGGCSNVVMRNVEIARCASMGVTIAPPSANFTFDNFNIRVPKDSEALYSSNADGIHVFGLAGHLSLDNCHFEGLGDDALNVHANAAKVSAIDPNGRSLSFCGRNGSVPPTNWARPSDHLVVYDRATYRTKGTLSIETIANGTLTARIPPTLTIVPGDMLANAAHLPCVRITNCSVRNTRARGFLLQSSEIDVSHCSFSNIALAGLLISTDFTKWYEAGPTRKALVRSCLFDRCSQRKCAANAGSLMITASHDKPGSSHTAGIHQNIRITDNVFRRYEGHAIFVEAASGVSVSGGSYEAQDRLKPVKFTNCEDTMCTFSPAMPDPMTK